MKCQERMLKKERKRADRAAKARQERLQSAGVASSPLKRQSLLGQKSAR
jgi:hypothetical protein